MSVHTYFVAFETYEPTGFIGWAYRKHDTIIELPKAVSTDADRLALKEILALQVTKDHPDGRGMERDTFLASIHIPIESVIGMMSITNIQHLLSRPSGAPAP